MTWHVVYHIETGEAYSVGTVVADPLPAGLASAPLADADADALNTGRAVWDAATLSVAMRPDGELPI